MTDAAQCSFCSSPATSKEHVIPLWLQRHYDLKDQAVGLWNRTSIKYSQAVIPACTSCNSQRFSKLERTIQSGKATKQEYYLWALKIRYGLAIRDSSLLLDRSKPERGLVLTRQQAEFGVEFVKHAFKAVDDPCFTFHPHPFGSVFLFKTPAGAADKFDLVDVPPPYWALSIVIPSGTILLVLFHDRGTVRKCLTRYYRGKGGIEALADNLPTLNARILMFSILRWQNHLILPSELRLNKTSLVAKCPSSNVKIRDQKVEWYYEMAKHCNLSDEIAEAAFRRDKVLFAAKSIRCK